MASIRFHLAGKGKNSIEPELFEHELYAIGYVTVQWGYMEHLLLLKTVELCEKETLEVPQDALSLQFKRRMAAFRSVVKQALASTQHEVERERLLKIATSISGEEQNRNRITHGLWDWSPRTPERMTASNLRPPYQFEESFDFDKLRAVGRRIGELCYEIEFPGGEEEVKARMAEDAMRAGGRISRLGLLMFTGKLPPQHPLAALLDEPPEGGPKLGGSVKRNHRVKKKS